MDARRLLPALTDFLLSTLFFFAAGCGDPCVGSGIRRLDAGCEDPYEGLFEDEGLTTGEPLDDDELPDEEELANDEPRLDAGAQPDLGGEHLLGLAGCDDADPSMSPCSP